MKATVKWVFCPTLIAAFMVAPCIAAGNSPLFEHHTKATVARFNDLMTDVQQAPKEAPVDPDGAIENVTDPWLYPICSTNPVYEPGCATDPWFDPNCAEPTMPYWGDPDCFPYTDPYFDSACLPQTDPAFDIACQTDPAFDPDCTGGTTDPWHDPFCITDPGINPDCTTDPASEPYCSTDPQWGNPDCQTWTNPDIFPECSTDPFMWYWCVTDPASGNPDCVTDPVVNPYCSTDPQWGNPDCIQVGTEDRPVDFGLMQNYPNPFNPSTTIEFVMAETGQARLAVYSLAGEEVDVLVDGLVSRGSNSVVFDAGHLASGVYIYTLEAAGQVETQKMILLK